ncbi:disease resistance protein RGA5-like [Oryza glaberrima]|uniref:disease resistance protein RGA5-like n=1 Tax=Oryza glaberrima TaxID=4538 RepID=UPI00224BE934|nr:disease resistance protein RGA5-like [Oryza glaberrima]
MDLAVPDPMPMVSSTTGAMISLKHKLTALEDQHPTLGGLRENLRSLVNGGVFTLATRRRRDALIGEWMLQVRGLIYDMEDWVDGCLTRPPSKPVADFWCSDIAKQVEEFKADIKDAQDRCRRYHLLSRDPTPDADPDADAEPSKDNTIDGGAKLLYGEAPCLVAIDEPKQVIVDHIMDDKQNHRKVVSIFGTRGIGKTALATEVYRKLLLDGKFDCGAFVYLGRNPSAKTIIMSVLDQVEPNWSYVVDSQGESSNFCVTRSWEEQEVIAKLWAVLQRRSYFVVLDDVRSIWTWKVISSAMPNNEKPAIGRILITTCSKDVAESCCIHPGDVVYEMASLGKDDSETLFDSKISVPKKDLLPKIYQKMLQLQERCGGIPLAITVTAGLLFCKCACSPRKSQMIDQYHSTAQPMREILEISYIDLPLPVKSCFLYLSAFPEKNIIKKDCLIWRWIAEGFIPERDNENLWETAERYFEELIARRLVQPAFDDHDDLPIGCTVHGVVLDFMVSLSAQENFITYGAELKSGLLPCDRARRFCLVSSDENSSCIDDELSRSHLSRVRSLAFSGDATRMPDVRDFVLVRVLDLEGTKGLGKRQLESIGCLSLLRYLGLRGTEVTSLPQELMALEHLSFLDLRGTTVKRVAEWTKLVTLLADNLVIPREIEGMPKLEEVSKVLQGHDGSLPHEVARFVNKWRQLRVLGVKFGRLNHHRETDRQGVKHFLEEVVKSNLQSILLDNYLHHLIDILVDSWAHKRRNNLRKFELRIGGCLQQVPKNIASLIALTHLHIRVSQVEEEGVRALGSLPNLVLLKLHSETSSRLTVSSNDGFPCLIVFWYVGDWMGLRFQERAMPQLRRLVLHPNAEKQIPDFHFSIQHLHSLVQVRATTDWNDTSVASRVEAYIRGQVYENPNRPAFELSRREQRSREHGAEQPVIAIRSMDDWMRWIDQDKLVVVHFTMKECEASRKMGPVFDELAARKLPNAVFFTVDIHEVRSIAGLFDVSVSPTFMFLKGGEIKDTVVGANKEKLTFVFESEVALMSSLMD